MDNYDYDNWYLAGHSLGGANHAGFGNYGPQEGDGEATMDREKQQDMTVQYIMKMINKTYE